MLVDQPLVFVTGKGGVGKSTIALALAQLSAERGRRTLIVDMSGNGGVNAALDTADAGYRTTPTPVDNLFAMTMNTEDALAEYLARYLPVPFVGRIAPLARTFDFIADAAPGVREILAVGKVCSDLRDGRWDTIVVDAEATGHAVSQIGAPTALRELVKFGIIYDQTGWMADMITDPALTTAVVVTTPEEFAVSEALDLVERLGAEAGVRNTMVVANRVLPAMFNRRQTKVIERLDEIINAEPNHVANSGGDDDGPNPTPTSSLGAGLAPLLEAAQVAQQRRQWGASELGRLGAHQITPLVVGECIAAESGVDDGFGTVVEHVADELAAELDLDRDDDIVSDEGEIER